MATRASNRTRLSTAACVSPIKAHCRQPRSWRGGSGRPGVGESRGPSFRSLILDNPWGEDTISWSRISRCTGLTHSLGTLESEASAPRFPSCLSIRASGARGGRSTWLPRGRTQCKPLGPSVWSEGLHLQLQLFVKAKHWVGQKFHSALSIHSYRKP